MPETFAVGAGQVEVADDGAVVAVLHPTRGHSMLLTEGTVHDPAHRWGKGFVVTDRGSHRFDASDFSRWRQTGIDLLYRLGDLELRVGRRFGEHWTETYEVRNTAEEPIAIGSLAVSTPYRDLYSSSRESLNGAVHAHLWTGGADSWAWAAPMDGSGPGLGLQLTEGELWAYSVESRDAGTGSNIRGHLYLHVTDHARAPHAMGGQPRIVLQPGDSYRWTWQLGWYDTLDALHATRKPLIDAATLVAEVGESIAIQLADHATGPATVTSATPGTQYVEATDGKLRSRVNVLFHEPLREIVERRVRFVLDHQRPVELSDSRRFSFVPYDNETGLRVLSGAWRDWSDARERIGTALLLQATRERGWGDRDELDEALAGYQRFVTEYLLSDDGTVADDSLHESSPRLYNFPWFARFFLGQGDVATAIRIIDRYYELGGDHFLAFDLGPILRELAKVPEVSARMRDHLARHARAFLDYGDDLPPHEVNYEQSMVAPLLELLIAAHQEAPDSFDPVEPHPPSALADRVRRGPARRTAAPCPDPALGRLLVRPVAAVGRRLPALLVDPQRGRLPDLATRTAAVERGHAARGGRPRDPPGQPGQLPSRRLGDLRVRLSERRQPSPCPHGRSAGQRPGLGAGLCGSLGHHLTDMSNILKLPH